MKTDKKIGFLVIAFLLILTFSCLRIIIVDSSAEIVSRSTDMALNGSALIYGTVYDGRDTSFPFPDANIWIEGTEIKTTSDEQGKFSLRVLPGTYTIKSLHPYRDVRFTMVLDNISLLPNEKIEVRFFHGNISE